MTIQSNRELAKRAGEIASTKHPGGYSKAQLIASSKEVFGGFGANPHKRIESMDDVAQKRNAMALIDGHYPLGMSDCETIGISGQCNMDCPVFLSGDCGEPQEFLNRNLGDDELELYSSLYGANND